jgi:hypothetical protein
LGGDGGGSDGVAGVSDAGVVAGACASTACLLGGDGGGSDGVAAGDFIAFAIG